MTADEKLYVDSMRCYIHGLQMRIKGGEEDIADNIRRIEAAKLMQANDRKSLVLHRRLLKSAENGLKKYLADKK